MTAAEDRAEAAAPRPARRFTEFVHARRTRRDPHRLPDDKIWARGVAAACGVATPEVLRSFAGAADVDLDGLPDRFVLKPLELTNRRGIFVLERTGGGWFDRMSSAVLTEDEIRGRLEALFGRFPRRRRTIVAEAFVETGAPIPLDYKLFVFGDEVALVEHININRRPKRICFYAGDFSVMDVEGAIAVDFTRARLDVPHVPPCRDAMLDAARRIAAHLATPFVRVDMYASRQGPVLGEISPAPGGAYYGQAYRFTDAYDARLGARWAAAAARLGQEIPQILGEAPAVARAGETVAVGALELRDLRSRIRALELEKRAAEAHVRRLENGPWRRGTRPFRAAARRLLAWARPRPE